MIHADEFFFNIEKNNPAFDLDLFKLAYEFAERAHRGQKRQSGEDYIHHPLAVANKLASMHLDQETIIAGLLHDIPEDTPIPIEAIQKEFGAEIATLVGGITKLGKLKYRGIDRYAENLRKMFVAMADDIRVIFIKFADRIDNLRTLWALPPEKQRRIAQESIDIYAQIAHRLGMRELRIEMEDLAFAYLDPTAYAATKKLFESRVPQSSRNIEVAIRELKTKLEEQHISYERVYGRVKHLYALHNKLKLYNGDINRIFDLIALRVITRDVGDCYRVLGLIHSLWKPISGRIKDYIASPKPNGYQSIHTTVFLQNGFPLECQIRTMDMHHLAEFGVAAHFAYKTPESKDGAHISKIQVEWIERLKNWQQEIQDNKSFLNEINFDIFKERIFVFTPRGDAIDLPENATPVDFAYHIHTDIGNSCVGAYINQELKSLDTPLRSGDMVEIITDKNKKVPSEDWLTFAKTHMARQHVKQALNKQRSSFLRRFLPKSLK